MRLEVNLGTAIIIGDRFSRFDSAALCGAKSIISNDGKSLELTVTRWGKHDQQPQTA